MAPLGVNIVPLINGVIDILEMLGKLEISEKLKSLFITAYNAGICSLIESNSIDYMLNKYVVD